MSLFISSINSGSNGNCYYVGNNDEAVLIDAGVTCREIEKRLCEKGLSLAKVKGIFISHEHTDHVRGLEGIIQKHSIPVYLTELTLKHSRLCINPTLLRPLMANEEVLVGDLRIVGFPKKHDACEPLSYLISCQGVTTGVFTDIGRTCKNVIEKFRLCHAAFLEANYDEVMLEEGRYPYFLKNRIRGGSGHLSNTEALKLFIEHRAPFLSKLFLSHLSRENNCAIKAREMFLPHAGKTEILIASRHEATEVHEITASALRLGLRSSRSSRPASMQMSLF